MGAFFLMFLLLLPRGSIFFSLRGLLTPSPLKSYIINGQSLSALQVFDYDDGDVGPAQPPPQHVPILIDSLIRSRPRPTTARIITTTTEAPAPIPTKPTPRVLFQKKLSFKPSSKLATKPTKAPTTSTSAPVDTTQQVTEEAPPNTEAPTTEYQDPTTSTSYSGFYLNLAVCA